VAHQCWRSPPKKTNSKKQYMLNTEEKKNSQDKKMGREKWKENAPQEKRPSGEMM